MLFLHTYYAQIVRMKRLRDRVEGEEFDYQTLMDVLSDYAEPRQRVTALLRSGEIIRVKKGLYVFGAQYRRRPFCRELLANLMYGPSCVSLETALAYHGLIPERVDALTSVTTGRSRRFETPIGLFIYRPTPDLSVGMRQMTEGGVSFLMATPERALADKLRADRSGVFQSQRELEVYLTETLRMERGTLLELNAGVLCELAETLRSKKVALLAAWVKSGEKRA